MTRARRAAALNRAGAFAPGADAKAPITIPVLGDRSICVAAGPPDTRIAAIAGAQRGRVHRRQLLRAGLSGSAIDRRCRSGTLIRRHPAVYALGHLAAVDFGDEAAALLAVGHRSMLTGNAGGALVGIRPAGLRPIELLGPDRGRTHLTGVVVHRSRTLAAADRRVVAGLPVAAPARLLIDLAATLAEDELTETVAFALQKRVVRPAELEAVLARAGGHPGRAALRRAAARAGGDAGTESRAERAMAELLRRAALPPAVRQLPVLRFRADFAWPELRLVLEVDGHLAHASRAAFARDRRRDAELLAAGWTVIRVTAEEVLFAPEVAIARIAWAIGAAQARAAGQVRADEVRAG